ncbi:MAG: histidine phosphatase family protein [Candidatus Avispirillum sp.]
MTTFYLVRHGEPDYESVGEWSKVPFGREFAGLTKKGESQICEAISELCKYSPQIVISSPYTRAMHGAAMISRTLNIPLFVERDLHEWDSDKSHTISSPQELSRLCNDFDSCNGVCSNGTEKQWESRQQVKIRVLKVLEKYLAYERVIVCGHAIMMQSVTGESRSYEYGEIVNWEFQKTKD